MQTLRNTAVKCAKKTFANKGHFEGHINSHNAIKPFKCTQCSSKFSFKSALLRHVKTCDKKNKEKPKSFRYDLCSSIFSRYDILVDHVKGKHEGKKLYRCAKCSASFPWRSSLSKHMMSKKHATNHVSLLK